MSALDMIKKALENAEGKKTVYEDDRDGDDFWMAAPDKAGNAFGEIRFLSAPKDDMLPLIKSMKHGWQNDAGKWFIEKCLTTIGQQCPICANNDKWWNGGLQHLVKGNDGKNGSKRKISYIANVLVINDPAKPENNGKVFKFRFGQKIFDKIKITISPPPEFNDPSVNVFDYSVGANFKLKMNKVQGQFNFDLSSFGNVSALSKEQIATVTRDFHPLEKYVDPANFKSYEEIDKRLQKFLNGRVESKPTVNEDADDDFESHDRKAANDRAEKSSKDKVLQSFNTGDDDDDVDFFASLATSS